jgi:hypothetical protein
MGAECQSQRESAKFVRHVRGEVAVRRAFGAPSLESGDVSRGDVALSE